MRSRIEFLLLAAFVGFGWQTRAALSPNQDRPTFNCYRVTYSHISRTVLQEELPLQIGLEARPDSGNAIADTSTFWRRRVTPGRWWRRNGGIFVQLSTGDAELWFQITVNAD